jgi:hypothetical protein
VREKAVQVVFFDDVILEDNDRTNAGPHSKFDYQPPSATPTTPTPRIFDSRLLLGLP